MKISIYYEHKTRTTVLEVPEDQCRGWVEKDYQQRLAAAEDKSLVQRRTPQQIMDEDYNKPGFNRNQTETRRHVLLSALDPQEQWISDSRDIMSDLLQQEEYAELYHAIEKLQPQQKELLYRVYWEEKKQSEIAKEENVSEAAIAGRMKRIYECLKKLLES